MHDLGNSMGALHIRYFGFKSEREWLYGYKQCCVTLRVLEGSMAQFIYVVQEAEESPVYLPGIYFLFAQIYLAEI